MAAECNEITNDAPIIHPRCIGSCDGCPRSGTTPLANGTYALTDLLMYSVDCDSLTTTNVRGKMQVSGTVMNLVIQQPAAGVGDTVMGRMQYTFTLSGATMNVQWVCPSMDGGTPATTGVNYVADGRKFHFSILPGVQGDAIFAPQ